MRIDFPRIDLVGVDFVRIDLMGAPLPDYTVCNSSLVLRLFHLVCVRLPVFLHSTESSSQTSTLKAIRAGVVLSLGPRL